MIWTSPPSLGPPTRTHAVLSQRALPRFQRDTISRGRQRERLPRNMIRGSVSWIAIRTDGPDPNRAVLRTRAAYHKGFKAPQFLGVSTPIHHQL